MPKVAVYKMDGTKAGEINLSDEVFGIEPNVAVMHQVVKAQLANSRQGTKSTLTRAEVSGGGIKPYRQKGTGRARQGSIRSPQFRHGGVVFAPKPRDFRQDVNKKVRQLAIRSALSSKVKDGAIVVLEDLAFEKPRTKEMITLMGNLKLDRKALFVLGGKNENVVLAARNIPGIKMLPADTLNVADILEHDSFVATREAVKAIEEVYSK
ncbi:MAG: 50S ribosomal protein L4 [Bacillota bacterium]|nr:50S ribosomal protein L4 [Bacillota bacterium]